MKAFLEQLNTNRLRAYEADPGLLKEQHGIEETVLAGGYGYRQILELVQNGADALIEANEQGVKPKHGSRIAVLLRDKHLYVANTGAPLSPEGLDALLRAHSSPKRGNHIGRFGLGFKSLLRLEGAIDLFTRANGAIRFDPKRCRKELSGRFKTKMVPGMRLAWPLEEGRGDDPVVAKLNWAETVVRAEIPSADILNHLRDEIQGFPAEFLLFAPIGIDLTLDDGAKVRQLSATRNRGGCWLLREGEAETTWRIVTRAIGIDDPQALKDATEIHKRATVPLSWAIPMDAKRDEAGRFWAFFPTQTPSYVPGILNAPWKLNSDRNAIIGGEWNSALMNEAASLIADNVGALSTPEDPGRPLDAFPRLLERKDEIAASLIEPLWKRLEAAAILPDGTGKLRKASELWRHPSDADVLAKMWEGLAGEASTRFFVHSSCLEHQRASRLKALGQRFPERENSQSPPLLGRVGAAVWFGLVADSQPRKALKVLELAEAYKAASTGSDWERERPTLKIIPTQEGALEVALRVVLAPREVSVPGRHSVSHAFESDPKVRSLLKTVMRVGEVDDRVWGEVLAEALKVPWHDDRKWEKFWATLRTAPDALARSFLKNNTNRINVLRGDGEWVTADRALFGGRLIERDDVENAKVLVDLKMHASDVERLKELGVTDRPEGMYLAGRDEVARACRDWLAASRAKFHERQNRSATFDYLFPKRDISLPRGIGLLKDLRGKANASLSRELLGHLAAFGQPVAFGHRTMPAYGTINVLHPIPWMLSRFGFVRIGDEAAQMPALIARRNEPALARIEAWNEIRPALCLLAETVVDLEPPEAEAIKHLWLAAIGTFATDAAVTDGSLFDVWLGAGKDGVVPEHLPFGGESIPLKEMFVTASEELAHRARRQGHLAVALDPKTLQLWLSKGAKDLSSQMRAKWTSELGPVELVETIVPEIASQVSPEARQNARCRLVKELCLKMGSQSEAKPCLMWERVLCIDPAQMAQLSRADRLRALLAEAEGAGWLICSAVEAHRRLGDAQVDELRARVAEAKTLSARLLLAVGGHVERLVALLGEGMAQKPFIAQCKPSQIADLALAQLGPVTLTRLRDVLEAEGLRPPARWGTSEAMAFVAAIGFPPEFASSAETRRLAEESITGPIELPPLHDFQEQVLEGLRSLLSSQQPRRRTVISLPTGGGKTRVTVEAAVRLVLASARERRSVLWIAQTDELCEQAVQAFRQVWVNLGSKRTNLRLVRLWGGHPDPQPSGSTQPVAVVASIQTLNSRFDSEALGWLRRPGLVVVDECHHAITPSYSNLLRWLDAAPPRTGAGVKTQDEPPIVGLSATPFRTDHDESRRLAQRFDRRWLPEDQENLYQRLREREVLARADYVPLKSTSRLTPEELEQLGQMPDPWEGIEFERLLEAINQRLADDEKRNKQLVEFIEGSAAASLLLFANSVRHAEEMSARLNVIGVPAAAISGDTPAFARRYFLDRFQSGAIRVLCNHSVLTTGFDAPRTDMVLIARQVFSPVRFMQMVGRGLRGLKNGGTASCRIVTVMDNLGRFQDQHPYHYCSRYFAAMEGGRRGN